MKVKKFLNNRPVEATKNKYVVVLNMSLDESACECVNMLSETYSRILFSWHTGNNFEAFARNYYSNNNSYEGRDQRFGR